MREKVKDRESRRVRRGKRSKSYAKRRIEKGRASIDLNFSFSR